MAAKKLGLNATAMVMLQIVGGAAGQVRTGVGHLCAAVADHSPVAAAKLLGWDSTAFCLPPLNLLAPAVPCR